MNIKLVLLLLSIALPLTGVAVSPAENWEASCGSCHGSDGRGSSKQGRKLKVKDYTDRASLASLSDDQLAAAIRAGVEADGKQRMRGYGDELSEKEIRDLVAFIRGLSS